MERRSLLDNSRFYILAASFLISLGVTGWLRTVVASDQLYYIRLEQVYGLLSIGYWYVALIISPLSYVFGKQRLAYAAFARRAIGVSAAYFAVLHLVVAVWGQLGGVSQLALLPPLFRWSLIAGAIAVVILLAMAATSFDAIVRRMTFRRWKWLHRVGYGGLILVIGHIWAIGTHVSYSAVQITAFSMLVLLAGLESYRVAQVVAGKYHEFQAREYLITVFLTVWLLWVVAILALPSLVTNYHQQRHSEGHSAMVTESYAA